ncbi:MAG TPA: DUF1232 domain-containing protein [Caldithrix abyssi]|uniref:DUF1232 domain-containing protein n=1 Tax=Caldithrix abyssi TaxID=187145 RepID=A0A7V5UF39_CALAY|nr:DUF1232 domain-containing protein [Caldithrix abyssi]
MDQTHQDFYKKLRRQINAFLEKKNFKYGDLLLLVPDFFHLLVKLSLDPRVPREKKIKLAAAIAYFFSPLDFIPEAILGPVGYMDDLAVAAYVLNDFINHGDLDLLYEHWAGESDVLASIQNILTVADSYLGQGLWERIKQRIQQQ